MFNGDQKNSNVELAFKYAVHKINQDKSILPKTELLYDIQYVPKDDSFHASKKGKSSTTFSSIILIWSKHELCPR